MLIPGAIVLAGVARGLAAIGQATSTNRVGHSFVGDMQRALVSNFIRADLARLRGEHSGTYLASVLYDSGLVREAATTAVVTLTQNALTVIGAVVVMFIDDPVLALIVLLGGPIASVVMDRYVRRTRKAAKGAMAETSALTTAVMESLDGIIRIVKIEGRETYEEARVGDVIERRQTHIIKGANAKASSAPTVDTITMIVTAAVIAYAGWRGVTVDALLSFLIALGIAGQALRMLANVQTIFSEGTTAARRIYQALDVKPAITRPGLARRLACRPACDVRIDNVVFAYHEGAQALSGVTLEAKRGESIALVGPSGGGKSTVLNMIPAFGYDPDIGRITLNDVDIREVTLADLRAKIALVTQEPFLFDDNIRANIAYARPHATDAEIVAAAEAAAEHEFIIELAPGLRHVGRRSRLAPVGRSAAAHRHRPGVSEGRADFAARRGHQRARHRERGQGFQVALERLMQGRTTLLIAHRLSTVRGADRIYVIDQGRVVEQGSHASLMSKGGLYARLAGSQDLETVAG